MSCKETLIKLSRLVDNELHGEELLAVKEHLSACDRCRLFFEEQGEINMMLKKLFVDDPSDQYFDSFWPTLSQRIDGAPSSEEKPSNGGGRQPHSIEDAEDLVFKASPAMQMLHVPERETPPVSTPLSQAAPPAHPWRWPFAFILSTAIAVGGIVYYKKSEPQRELFATAPSTIGVQTEPAPSTEEDKTPGTESKVALASPEETEEKTASEAPSEETRSGVATESVSAKGAPRSARTKRPEGESVAVREKTGENKEPSKPGESAMKTESKAEPAAKSRGKGDELDNLIDTAIGPGPAPSLTKKAEPVSPSPTSDLPNQLTINQIQDGMRKIKSLVQSCYDQHQVEGLALVTVVITNDGVVKETTIKGKFFGTDTGNCVGEAVKKARFPKFGGKEMKINNYPFQLQ